jgi:hypothetical protein
MSTKQKEGVDFSEWKNLIQGFVGNVLERISDNVSQKIHAWIKVLKLRTAGFILVVLGAFYLLIGVSVFLNSVLGIILPGLGYVTVGVLAILIGSLLGKSKA